MPEHTGEIGICCGTGMYESFPTLEDCNEYDYDCDCYRPWYHKKNNCKCNNHTILKKEQKNFQHEIKNRTNKTKTTGLLLAAILTDDQKKDWHKTLLSVQFKPIRRWVNENTNNFLTLYVLTTGRQAILPKK